MYIICIFTVNMINNLRDFNYNTLIKYDRQYNIHCVLLCHTVHVMEKETVYKIKNETLKILIKQKQ